MFCAVDTSTTAHHIEIIFSSYCTTAVIFVVVTALSLPPPTLFFFILCAIASVKAAAVILRALILLLRHVTTTTLHLDTLNLVVNARILHLIAPRLLSLRLRLLRLSYHHLHAEVIANVVVKSQNGATHVTLAISPLPHFLSLHTVQQPSLTRAATFMEAVTKVDMDTALDTVPVPESMAAATTTAATVLV